MDLKFILVDRKNYYKIRMLAICLTNMQLSYRSNSIFVDQKINLNKTDFILSKNSINTCNNSK